MLPLQENFECWVLLSTIFSLSFLFWFFLALNLVYFSFPCKLPSSLIVYWLNLILSLRVNLIIFIFSFALWDNFPFICSVNHEWSNFSFKYTGGFFTLTVIDALWHLSAWWHSMQFFFVFRLRFFVNFHNVLLTLLNAYHFS